MFPKHPKAGRERSINKVLHIVQREARLRFLQREVLHYLRLKLEEIITFKFSLSIHSV